MTELKQSKVSVIGLGYIGLPTALTIANTGTFDVLGIDTNIEIVETLRSGATHFDEPGINELLTYVLDSGDFHVGTELEESDVFIICVPTPVLAAENIPEPDLKYVKEAVSSISRVVRSTDTIILESTCPVGSTFKVATLLQTNGVETADLAIGYCPERVLPGNILSELRENDRLVGGLNDTSTKVIAHFYRSFVSGKVFETDSKTAEMCKLAENSYRDVNIAYANELSVLCGKHGINSLSLISLANRHPRVSILDPGIGVGGHCIAVDPWFLVSSCPESTKLIQTARRINMSRPAWVVSEIFDFVAQNFTDGKIKIACLGITYKANVDDTRGSPAMTVIKCLIDAGFDVLSVDPNLSFHPKIKLHRLEDALEECDLVVGLVSHREFINCSELQTKIFLDFCGITAKK